MHEEPDASPSKGSPRTLEVIVLMAAYNEDDLIHQTIGHLVERGLQVHLIDHHSTDTTVAEASRWLGQGLLHVETFPEDSGRPAELARVFSLDEMLRRKEELARKLEADWFVSLDADQIPESLWPDRSLREAIELADRRGYSAIAFQPFRFPPLDDRFQRGLDPTEHFTRYEPGGDNRIVAWKARDRAIDLASSGGRAVRFPGRRVFPIPFPLRHYPVRSQPHGERKVFRDRQPRLVPGEVARGLHAAWAGLLPGHRFLADPASLLPFELDRVRVELQVRAWSGDPARRVALTGEPEVSLAIAAATPGPSPQAPAAAPRDHLLARLSRDTDRLAAQVRSLEDAMTRVLERDETRSEGLEELTDQQARLRLQLAGLRQALGTTNQSLERLKARVLPGPLKKLLSTAPSDRSHLGELTAGRRFGQVFESPSPGLASLLVQLGTFGRTTPCMLRLRLGRELPDAAPSPSRWLREVELDASTLANHQHARFRFDPLEEAGRYYFEIDSPDALPGTAVTAFVKPGTGLWVDGEPREGSLAFETRGTYETDEEDAGSEAAEAAPSSIRLAVDWPPLDRPVPVTLGGTLEVTGWAFSTHDIERIEVRADGALLGQATHGYWRRDVAQAYANKPGASLSGFQGFVDLSPLEEGEHELSVHAVDREGEARVVSGKVDIDHTAWEVPLRTSLPDYNHLHQVWLRRNRPSREHLLFLAQRVPHLRAKPRLSLLIAARDGDPVVLRRCVDSVLEQIYPAWELVVVEAGPLEERARDVYREAAAREPRIRLLEPASGTGEALNAALFASTGEHASLLGPGDVLWPNALYEVASHLALHPESDVVYTDHDRITPEGRHRDPFFKPDWSPELLLSINYLGPLAVFRRDLAAAAGGVDEALPGAWEHDLALKVTERARHVAHLPAVLCSSRLDDEDGAGGAQPPFARAGSRAALEAAARRRGIAARVQSTRFPEVWQLRREVTASPLVSMLLVAGTERYLERLVRSILERTRYPHYEIVVVDTSHGGEVGRVCERLEARSPRVRRLRHYRRPFSHSVTNNYAARHSRGDMVLLLNDDMEVLTPEWLTAMVELAQVPDVGVVGCRLQYPDGTIQHAGTVLGIGDVGGHAFRHFPGHEPGYQRFAELIRETGAVTFACALLRRQVWDELGGLDEHNVPLSWNDVDLCLRARAAGYRVLYTPYARLIHYESVTRKATNVTVGYAYMRRRWARELARDPYYSPHLTLRYENWCLEPDRDEP